MPMCSECWCSCNGSNTSTITGEGADARCLRPLGPVHVEGQAHHDALGGVGREHPCEGLQIAAATHPLHGPDPLGRDPQLVADGDPDARVAHVEGCDAHEEGINSRPGAGQTA